MTTTADGDLTVGMSMPPSSTATTHLVSTKTLKLHPTGRATGPDHRWAVGERPLRRGRSPLPPAA
jgi:hypothetical protein